MRAFIAAAMFVGVGVAVFSPWLIRNLAWTGNPVFPEATRLFGRGHFSEGQAQRWQRAHAPRDDQRSAAARLDALVKQVLLDWRFGYVLLPLALAAAALEWWRRETFYLLLILLLLTILWLFFTHLQGRFIVLAIPIAGLLIGHVRSARGAAVLAILIVLAAGVGIRSVYKRINPQILPLIGLERLTALTPLADVTLRDGERLLLLGDARAFLYDVPMSRMQYRTVFDVPAGRDVEDWTRGMQIEPGKTLALVDPAELNRFRKTYQTLPPLPGLVEGRSEPYFERE